MLRFGVVKSHLSQILVLSNKLYCAVAELQENYQLLWKCPVYSACIHRK